MSPAAKVFLNKHLDESNGISWPSDEIAKTEVAQTILGIGFISVCDYWYHFARDLVINAQPEKPYTRPWSDIAKRDKAYRELFSGMNDDQRKAVLRLLHEVIDGTLYSTLVKLDQFPHANVHIHFVNRDVDLYTYNVRVSSDELNLHEHWQDWVREFSDNPRA